MPKTTAESHAEDATTDAHPLRSGARGLFSQCVDCVFPWKIVRPALAGVGNVWRESVLAKQDVYAHLAKELDTSTECAMLGLPGVEVRQRHDRLSRAAGRSIEGPAASGLGNQPEGEIVLVCVGPLRRRIQRHRGDEERIGGQQDIRFVGLLVGRSHRVPGQFGQRWKFLLKPSRGGRSQDQIGVETSLLREGDGVPYVADQRRGASDQVQDRSSLYGLLGRGAGRRHRCAGRLSSLIPARRASSRRRSGVGPGLSVRKVITSRTAVGLRSLCGLSSSAFSSASGRPLL